MNENEAFRIMSRSTAGRLLLALAIFVIVLGTSGCT